MNLLLILAGLAVLIVGGDLLVRGAVGLAAALRIPALIISLTIVAFGTSAPEFAIAIKAVLADQGGLALGDLIGAGLANIFLVLGAAALLHPVSARTPGLRAHAIALLVATAAFAWVAYERGHVGPRFGPALLAGLALYVAYTAWHARGAPDPVLDETDEYSDYGGNAKISTPLYLVAGLIGLPVGAHLVVSGAIALGAGWGVETEIVGLTLIALGTTLPELATVAAAALHKRTDVAIGAAIGSTVFNMLAVGGATGLFGGAAFGAVSLGVGLPALIAAVLVLAAFILVGRDIGKPVGVAFLAAYAAFLLAVTISAP